MAFFSTSEPASPGEHEHVLLPLDASDRLGTRAVHAGSHFDPHNGAVIPSISLATTFAQSAPGKPIGPYDYSRAGNPNRIALESLVAALEIPITQGGSLKEYSGAEGDMPPAVAFSSGSAGTAAIIQALVGAGNHLVSVSDVYGGTNRYLSKVATALGIKTTFIDMSSRQTNTKDEEAAEADRLVRALNGAMRPNTKLIWAETPTNPTLRLVNIEFIAKFAHSHDSVLVVDNTFASPYYQRPLEHGADLVLHSASKFIGGHSDVIMGVVVAPHPAHAEALRFQQKAVGAIPSPFDCWLAQRGAKTLQLRMQRHGLNSLQLAKFLKADPRVDKVHYHGLPGTTGSQLAWHQLSREAKEWATELGYDPDREGFPYSAMITMRLNVGSEDQGEAAQKFFEACRLFTLAESLGGVESLAGAYNLLVH